MTTTPAGMTVLQPLWQTGAATLWIPETLRPGLSLDFPTCTIQTYSGSLKAHLETLWPTHHSFVFCLATGAVVRLIAPLLQDKATDPAIVVVDLAGRYVISLCGGHQGGADALTRSIAHQLGATPILTGGANGLNLPAIDLLGMPFGWQRGAGNWTGVSAAVAQGRSVQVIQEAGSRLWQKGLPEVHPFGIGHGEGESGIEEQGAGKDEDVVFAPEAGAIEQTPHAPFNPQLPTPDSQLPQPHLWISPIQRHFSPETEPPQAQWHPRVLWVGVGCERGTARSLIESAIQEVCQTHQFAEGAIAGIATIDLKSDEAGILELCHDRQWPLRCFAADQLRSVVVPTPSDVVAAEVGTPSVAEAAAILASQENPAKDRTTQAEITQAEITQASPIPSESSSPLRVAKTIFRQPGQPGAVTVAIAEAEQEFTGRSGRLWLVGTGPGELTQMTPAAQTAISQADVVIGYTLYLDLVSALLHPGQIIEAWPITQERQRAERAIELAQWGLTVAVISSGDCGIYGMAGLVLEQLQQQGWDGKTPDVQVFPGISALQAAASRVGAPLMHDFCAISLSDLLTPWDVIKQRLIAAAQADFVTALYNPRSQTRVHQIETAQQLFLEYRDPQTPVAIVRSVYRPDEHITLTTLDKFLENPIDMLTTVIIGNRSTQIHANTMITPRGYLGFGD
ncbi:precorrin-3B C(17)-methyltransferase [Egbenema bharatensis]|uniref:precorrin-3B C(17)-methyltransferase n=1 Tax=Egbenema bharatensis TaxID=3463334 RepID=UPI003A83EC68